MPNLFSTFSSKLLRNAGFWTVFIVALLEGFLNSPLQRRFANHEVDVIARDLRFRRFDAPAVLLGDSVAENVFRGSKGQENRFVVLASNQAVEMTGQYFFLRRYLEVNPAPGAVLLMAGRPFAGDLDQVFTENYIQRVFTRSHEIAWMTAHTWNPAFGAKALAYRLLPSYRYRTPLQQKLFGFTHADAYTGIAFQPSSGSPDDSKSLSHLLQSRLRRLRTENASRRSWERLLSLCADHGITLVFAPSPTPANGAAQTQAALSDIAAYSSEWPNVHIWPEEAREYPDDHFFDGAHFNRQGQAAHRAATRALLERILRLGKGIELQRQRGPRHSIYDLAQREELAAPLPFTLEGFYPLEGQRAEAFRWSHPVFRVHANPAVSTLTLDLNGGGPARSLWVRSNGLDREFALTGKAQTLRIETVSPVSSFDFEVPAWTPGNGDTRALGISLRALLAQ